ncbi:MAG: hypothetical protein Fues2KO_38770 [Fuerstiella sp.]
MPNLHRQKQPHGRRLLTSLLITALLLPGTGCSRRYWREQAERQSYQAIAEKLNDERWLVPRVDITADPRSRFYDPYDPDCKPLPPDDPAAHTYMHCVNGIPGSKHWHDFGDMPSIENPSWLDEYAISTPSGDPVFGHPMVKIPEITLNNSVELAYLHSREYQTAIEDVYISALAVSQRRYQLGTRFLVGGAGDLGGVIVGGGGVGGRNGVGGALLNSSLEGGSNNDNGSVATGIGVTRLMPWGMQVGVDILNTLSWGTNSSASTVAWTITQPVLQNAGRKVVMEALTQSERTLLYRIRDLARFRQQLFTGIASDYLFILRQIQNITNLKNNIRQLEEQIKVKSAEDGRLPEAITDNLKQPIADLVVPPELASVLRYDDDPLAPSLTLVGQPTDEQKAAMLALSEDPAYRNVLNQLFRFKETQVVSLDIAQLVTQLNSQQNRLADAQRILSDLEDQFKIRLGLPPDIVLSIDDSLLLPFQLIAEEIVDIEASIKDLSETYGVQLVPEERADPDGVLDVSFANIRDFADRLSLLSFRVRDEALASVRNDFVPLQQLLDQTKDDFAFSQQGDRYFRTEEERERVIEDIAWDLRLFRLKESDYLENRGQIDFVQKLLAFKDIDDLLQTFDDDKDGSLALEELPPGWSSLPQAGSISNADKLSRDDLLLTIRNAVAQIRDDLLQVTQSLQVSQVGLRVEAIALNPLRLPGADQAPTIDEVVTVGLANRHDLMNARAEVMDARRGVEIAASALMSTLNLRASGTVDVVGDPGTTRDANLSVDFKSPLTQIAQRNAYNSALINYQRARRDYMLLEDRVKQEIRESWRQLMVSEERLEIDRQTVRNAALQYDSATLQSTGAGQNNSLNLLRALESVQGAQDSLVRDWITYETNRLNIFRDMGIMEIDSDGVWADDFYQQEVLTAPGMPAPAELFPQLQSEINPAPPAVADPAQPENEQ